MEKPLSDNTIWHHHKLINAMLNAAVDEDILHYNPAEKMKDAPKRPKDVEIAHLDDVQFEKFIWILLREPDIRKKTALLLAIFTSARKGELCGLTWDNFCEERQTIRIEKASQYLRGIGVTETPTKNKHSVRTIKIPMFAVDLLKEYYKWWCEQKLLYGSEWKGEKRYLFIQKDGRPIFPKTVYGWLQSILEENGFPMVSLHSIRHSALSWLIAKGVDIKTVQSISGHKKASTLLDIYAHAFERAQDKVVKSFEEVINPLMDEDSCVG